MQKRNATEDKKSDVYINDIEEERNRKIKRMMTLKQLIDDYERSKVRLNSIITIMSWRRLPIDTRNIFDRFPVY